MLGALGTAVPPEPQPVTGTLYPLGLELRHSAQLVSIVAYGLLAHAGGAEFVRLTRSRFKVDAIRGDDSWLLFPDTEPLLDALVQSRALDVQAMLLLPGGDLLWNPAHARLGPKCKLLDVAARYLAPQASDPALIRPLPPLERHPIQLAEPLVLVSFALHSAAVQLPDGSALPLDARWNATQLPDDTLAGSAALFGLLRYDAGRWALQPFSVANRAGKLAFVGQGGAKLLKKPPKLNPVAILEERAGRLLRK
jgi:hypothetical protein